MATLTRLQHFAVGSDAELEGDLSVPDGASGVVVFANGSGRRRDGERARAVAGRLVSLGLGTLLVDLLTAGESADRRLRFDIDRLTGRLVGIVDVVHAELPELRIGLFGANTGAAGALGAAAVRPERVVTVVSCGGRPDLAGAALDTIAAPTLLIVGGVDRAVLGLNREALSRLPAGSAIEIIPGATHLSEEPDALGDVVRVAVEWFERRLAPGSPASGTRVGERS